MLKLTHVIRDKLFAKPGPAPTKSRGGNRSRRASPARSSEVLSYHGQINQSPFRGQSTRWKRVRSISRRINAARPRLCHLFHIILMICAQIICGSLSIVAFSYTLKTLNWHVFLCMEGWQYFAAEAILATGLTNAWGCAKRSLWRRIRLLHTILQCFGITYVSWGTITILFTVDKKNYGTHAVLGIITWMVTVLSVLCGPVAFLSRYTYFVRFFHSCLGLINFWMTSTVAIMGLDKKKFKVFYGKCVAKVLTWEIILCTCYITMMVIINGCRRIRVANKTIDNIMSTKT